MARRSDTAELVTLGRVARHPSIERALDAARDLLNMDIAYVTHFDGNAQVLDTFAGDPGPFGLHEGQHVPMQDTLCRHVLESRMAAVVPDLRTDPWAACLPVTAEIEAAAFASVPLRLGDGAIYGTLCCLCRSARPLDERDEQFLHVLARIVCSELEREQAADNHRRLQLQAASTFALAAAMEARDQYTGEHSRAVVEHAGLVAQQLGLDAEAVAEVEHVALLHDIGKLAIPDAILHHPGPLDDAQWAVMRTHTAASQQIVNSIPGLAHLGDAVRAEHERWDGDGYPDCLSGHDIPIASRITLVCDAFHAMTSDRPYRTRMSTGAAVDELRRGAGTQFDPQVVDAMLAVLTDA